MDKTVPRSRRRVPGKTPPADAASTPTAPPPDPEEAERHRLREQRNAAVMRAMATMQCPPFNVPPESLKAADLVLDYKVTQQADGTWLVAGASRDYVVDDECECPQGSMGRSKWCKHVVSCELYNRVLMVYAGRLPDKVYGPYDAVEDAGAEMPQDYGTPDGRWPVPEPTEADFEATNPPETPPPTLPTGPYLVHVSHQEPRHWSDREPPLLESFKWVDSFGVERMIVVRADDIDELTARAEEVKQQVYQQIARERAAHERQPRRQERPARRQEEEFEEEEEEDNWCDEHRQAFQSYTQRATGERFLAHKLPNGKCRPPGGREDRDNGQHSSRRQGQGGRGQP